MIKVAAGIILQHGTAFDSGRVLLHARELHWSTGLAERLADDGVVRTHRTSGSMRVALSTE